MDSSTRKEDSVLPTSNSNKGDDQIQLSKLRGPNVVSGPPRRTTSVELDVNLILTTANAHEHFQIDWKTHGQNLPEFEELFFGNDDDAKANLEAEVRRLKAVAGRSDDEVYAWDSTHPTYSSLSASELLHIVDHLTCNLAILEFKNALLLVENLRFNYTDPGIQTQYAGALSRLQRSRHTLVTRFVQTSSYVRVKEPSALVPDTAAWFYYDLLVNYTTECMARAIIESADGLIWNNASLAVLARMSRKLKDLKLNAKQSADDCIASTEYLIDDVKEETSDARKRYVFNFAPTEQSYDLLDDTSLVMDYFMEQHGYRAPLCDILRSILYSLQLDIEENNTGFLREDFDFSTLIQAAEAESALVLTSDSHRNISSTTDEVARAVSYTGCRLLLPLVQHIGASKTKPTDRGAAAALRWWWQGAKPRERDLAYIDTLDECVSILVALVLTSSGVARRLSSYIRFVSSLGDDAEGVTIYVPPKGVRLAFTFARLPIIDISTQGDPDLMSLSTYIIKQQHADLHNEADLGPGTVLRQQYQKRRATIDEFTCDSETIVIKCRWVVAGIVLPSILIALAGVALLLAPYHKPKNVDPSNFMIFMWSIALSFLLVGKAFFVPDWAWHDFLRANVACRSVSEVRRITGIDSQLIIMHLLAHQQRLALRLRGPYVSLFTRNADEAVNTTGFSIDESISLQALYAAGFLVLKVNNILGPRLVIVDGRHGGGVRSDARKVQSMRLVGEPPTSLNDTDSHSVPKIRLKMDGLAWNHVMGLYVNKSAMFV